MKRYLMLFIVLVPGLCFASLSVDTSVGYKGNAQMEGNLDLGLSLALDDNTYTLLTRGGEYLSLQYERNGDFSSRFSYLYGAVANIYGEDAVSLLVDGLCSFSYGSRNVNLSLGFGAQGGIVKYRFLDNFFFSLSPLVDATITLISDYNTIELYLSFLAKEERLFKAVPTFGFSIERKVSDDLSFTFEAWERSADYLMDPYITIQSFGAKVGVSLRGDI